MFWSLKLLKTGLNIEHGILDMLTVVYLVNNKVVYKNTS